MALAVVERNALLEEVWRLQAERDYRAIIDLIGELPLEEHQKDPELGVILSYSWYQLGELNKSIVLIRQIASACERRGNTRLSRRRMNNEALILLARGEIRDAEPLLHRTVMLAEEAEDTQIYAWATNNLGIMYYFRGMMEFALSHFRRSIAVGQRMGDVRHLALCHLNTSSAYHKMGQFNRARAHLDEAFDLSKRESSESEVATLELLLGFIAEATGDLSLAASAAERGMGRLIKIGNRKGQGDAIHLQARIFVKKGRLAEGRTYLEKALLFASETSNLQAEASALEDLANLDQADSRADEFTRHLAAAILIHERMGNMAEADRLRARLQ